jgi:DNA polymerase-3 subunit alpha
MSKMKHPIMGYENLHRHSEYSLLDGFAKVGEYASYSKEANQRYLCITDHGVMGAVPQQIGESEKHGLKPIFGIEFYINPFQPKSEYREQNAEHRKGLGSEAEQKRFDKSHHLLGIARTNQGYTNLVRLSTWAWVHGYYRRPRLNHDVLNQYKEGIIFTSTCANSEIANALFDQGEDAAMAKVQQYIDFFGKDNFFLELMMLDFKMQKPYDKFLLKAAEHFGLQLILSTDCHYCKKEHALNQRMMLMVQTGRTMQEIDAFVASGSADDLFELQDTNLWMKTEDEMNQMWEEKYQDTIDYEIFKTAKANTVKVCEMCAGVQIDRGIKLPIEDDEKKQLMALIREGVDRRKVPMTRQYLDRIKEEYSLICDKGFASYFLIQKKMVDEALRVCPEIYGFQDSSMARGPGRGSVGGSLVAYCLDIHDLDPIKHGLLFSRFLSPARGGKQMKTRFTLNPCGG